PDLPRRYLAQPRKLYAYASFSSASIALVKNSTAPASGTSFSFSIQNDTPSSITSTRASFSDFTSHDAPESTLRTSPDASSGANGTPAGGSSLYTATGSGFFGSTV